MTPGPWLDHSTLEWLHEPKELLSNSDDARLMGFAPELYAACKLMQKSLNGSPGDLVGMLAAHRQLDVAVALVESEKPTNG